MKDVAAYAIVAILALTAATTGASAAEPEQSSVDGPRLVVRAVAGLIPDTTQKGKLLGIGAGITFGPNHRLEVVGEFGHLSNTMSSKVLGLLLHNFNEKDQLPDNFFGPTDHFDFNATAPAKYFVALGHVEVVKTGRVSAFVEGGAGRMRTDLRVTVSVNSIDRSAELTAIWTKGKMIGTYTFGMYVIGGGGSVRFSDHASIDAGLRLALVPNGDYPLNTTQAFVGFVWKQ